MRSPTAALVWEIWHQHRAAVTAVAGLTLAGRLLDILESPTTGTPLTMLLGMVAFLILFAIFNYTDSGGSAALGRFPDRLFTRPVSSLRLVTIPVLAGIASVELLYLLWMEPFARGSSVSRPFVALLFASLMVFYHAVLWTLSGSTRLLVLGVIATAVFGIGLLPSFPPTPAPWWRSEAALAALVAGLAVAAFLHAWTYVADVRAGDRRRGPWLETVIDRIADTRPARMRGFSSPAAAHFWFEWQCSGLVLPVLAGSVLLLVIAPASWLWRGDGGATMQLLVGAMATPIVLALPVGRAFAKPVFWSEDTALPAFIAVRPVSADDLVAIKVRVAAASAGLSWLLVVSFLVVWLWWWANLDLVRQLVIQLWTLHGRSAPAVYGIGALVVVTGMSLTWKFLVSGLWIGLSGSRRLLAANVGAFMLFVIAVAVFDPRELPGWLLDDQARLSRVVWIAAAAFVAKCAVAVLVWRRITPRYVRGYMVIWAGATASFIGLALIVLGVARADAPAVAERLWSLAILAALMAVPLARIGLSPSQLTRNRHR